MENNTEEEQSLSEESLNEREPGTDLTGNEEFVPENYPTDNQPSDPGKKPRKNRGGKWIWIGVLVFVLLLAAGVLFGYRNGVALRLENEKSLLMEQISLQLEWAY